MYSLTDLIDAVTARGDRETTDGETTASPRDVAAALANFSDLDSVFADCWTEPERRIIDAAVLDLENSSERVA